MADLLYIVVPCYNEEEALPESTNLLLKKLYYLIQSDKISDESKILLVDDGSKDNTFSIMQAACEKEKHISCLKLSHNRGHQNALLAGLFAAVDNGADMIITIDADLQDDINAIDKMVDEYYQNSDIVYGVRSDRKTDTFFKRTTAQVYYKFMKALGVEIVYNHADFRLMSKRAVEALKKYDEVNLFLRGIVPLLGFRCSTVLYERSARKAGESKYPLKKMISFALDGITSFSVKPIRLITLIGGIIFTISIIMIIYSILAKLFAFTVQGWTSLICSIWFIGGIQLLSLGIIGEYIGKIYFESKKRPRYNIEKSINIDKK